MASSQRKKTTKKSTPLDVSDTERLPGQLQEYLARLSAGLVENIEVNTLLQHALRESYLENTTNLMDFAQKVRFYNALKKRIREHLRQVRVFRASLNPPSDFTSRDQAPIEPYPTLCFDTFPTFGKDGKANVKVTKGEPLRTLGALEGYMASLEKLLLTVGDDAELANIDLQNWLQKVQQSLQAMSNISKVSHDAAMAVIRKIS